MSIVAYTGLPGSGKSYSVVEQQILPALKQGRVVVTNLALRLDALEALSLPGQVETFDIAELQAEPHKIRDYCKPGCIFIIDEVWKLWPQGMQANKVPDEYKALIAEHRHMVDAAGNSTQIVLVVQDLANIAAFGRRLVENTFVTTKLSMIGLTGSYRVDVFYGAQTGATPPVSTRLRMITGRYKKEIFALYKSHTMAVDALSSGANEGKIDRRANILRRPVFIIGAVAVPLIAWFSLRSFGNTWHKMAGDSPLMHHPQPADPAAREAERSAQGFAPPAVGAPVAIVPDIRLLFVVIDSHDLTKSVAYMGVGERNVVLPLTECRKLVRSMQCRYNGAYYDGVGQVDRVGELRDVPPGASVVNLDPVVASGQASSVGSSR